MHRALIPHPDSRSDTVSRIDVNVAHGADGLLVLHYRTTGLPQLPPLIERDIGALRTDDLWRHTCFEVFAKCPNGETYYEFNFSPDRRWAAYQFDGYRRNRRDLPIPPPGIEVLTDGGGLALLAKIRLETLARDWKMGLSAVIEDENGKISYWALRHPPGNPDFHHIDCFALEFAP